MTFDPTVRFGDILPLLIFLLGGLWFIRGLRGDLEMLARDIVAQGKKLEKLETVITAQAVQTERLDNMDNRIEELRHGRGFVEVDVNGLYMRHGKIQNIP